MADFTPQEFTSYELGLFDDHTKPGEIESARNLSFFMNSTHNPTYSNVFSTTLVAAGGMCPAHVGHIKMLEAAASALLEQKRVVQDVNAIRKILVPGHDSYLQEKTNGVSFIPIQERLMLAERVIKDYAGYPRHWYVGGESMFFSSEVHFDVIRKIYVDLFGDNVWMVFGSDNARFATFYARHGKCVVVKRPGYEKEFEKYKNDTRLKNPNIVFVDSEDVSNFSSSSIRLSHSYSPRVLPRKVHIRAEGRMQSKRKHSSPIVNILRDYFDEVVISDVHTDYKQFGSLPRNSLYLDPDLHFASLRDSNFNRIYQNPIDVSRIYKPGGYSQGDLGHQTMLTANQLYFLRQLHPEGVHLIDADTYTGSTFKFMRDMLERNGIKVLSERVLLTSNNQEYEILDEKDFSMRSYRSGLVTQEIKSDAFYPYSIKTRRLPYIYPFVCPWARASIPHQYAIEFSKRVIKAYHLESQRAYDYSVSLSSFMEAPI